MRRTRMIRGAVALAVASLGLVIATPAWAVRPPTWGDGKPAPVASSPAPQVVKMETRWKALDRIVGQPGAKHHRLPTGNPQPIGDAQPAAADRAIPAPSTVNYWVVIGILAGLLAASLFVVGKLARNERGLRLSA
jgi:hypothetical protein